MDMAFTIPVEVISEMNWRGHWAVRNRRFKKQKQWVAVHLVWYSAPASDIYTITLTRIKGPRQRNFDDDNLQSAFKAIRDAIAERLGIDDGSNRLTWLYGQEKGERAGVRIEIKGETFEELLE